jgi:hypothetical protein
MRSHTRITRADRLDRPLLILALAYILLRGLGLLAWSRCRPSCWAAASNNDCGILTIGRIMLDQVRCTGWAAFYEIIDAYFDTVPKFTTFTPEMPSWNCV